MTQVHWFLPPTSVHILVRKGVTSSLASSAICRTTSKARGARIVCEVWLPWAPTNHSCIISITLASWLNVAAVCEVGEQAALLMWTPCLARTLSAIMDFATTLVRDRIVRGGGQGCHASADSIAICCLALVSAGGDTVYSLKPSLYFLCRQRPPPSGEHNCFINVIIQVCKCLCFCVIGLPTFLTLLAACFLFHCRPCGTLMRFGMRC